MCKTPCFGPYSWRSIFIDHKRTQVEIAQPQEDVKCRTCVKHKVKTCVLTIRHPQTLANHMHNLGKEQINL